MKRKANLRAVVAAMMAGTILCTAGPALAADYPSSWKGSMVFEGKCMFAAGEGSQNEGAFLGAIVSGLVSKGVDAVGKALKKGGEDRTHVYTSTTSIDLSSGKLALTSGNCIRFIQGEFFVSAPPPKPAAGKKNEASNKAWKAWEKRHDWSDKEAALDRMAKIDSRMGRTIDGFEMALVAGSQQDGGPAPSTNKTSRNIHLADRPDVFVELQVEVTEDGKAMRFRPTALILNKSEIKRDGGRTLVAQLIFHDTKNAYSDAEVSNGSLVMGEFEAGRGPWIFTDAKGKTFSSPYSPWFTPYKKTAGAKSAEKGKEDSNPDEAKDKKKTGSDSGSADKKGDSTSTAENKTDPEISKDQNNKQNQSGTLPGGPSSGEGINENNNEGGEKQEVDPFNVTFKLVETAPGSKFMKILGGIVEENKEGIDTEIQKLVLKSKKEEAAIEKMQADAALESAWLEAWKVAEEARFAYCKAAAGQEAFNASVTYIIAHRKLNIAARQAEQEEQIPIIAAPSDKAPEEQAEECKSSSSGT